MMLLRIIVFLCLPSLTFASTHYISTSGSDSNNGTSTATPWAHLPCMASATSTAAAYTPVAGDTFILKGGDTWTNANFPCSWQWSGSSGNLITITVDQAWFAGASWARPIWTAGGAELTGANNVFFIFNSTQYVKLDNIEMTGLRWSHDYGFGQCAYILAYSASNIILDHLYIHGWSHAAYPTVTDSCVTGVHGDTTPPYVGGSLLQNSVFDGSDSTNGGDMGAAMYAWGGDIKNNVFNSIPNNLLPIHSGTISGNLVSNCQDSIDPVTHENEMEVLQGSTSNGIFYIHDNVIRDGAAPCEGGLIGNPGETDYVWNNVWYNRLGNSPALTQDALPGNAAYFWNNIIVAQANGYCIRPGHSGTYSVIEIKNNHCITTAASAFDPSLSATTLTISNNVFQSPTTASGQGYTSSQSPYVYYPTSGGSTIGAGANLSSNCSGENAGLCSDTTYAVTRSGNTVSGAARTATARGSTWDVGAFQFVSGGGGGGSVGGSNPTGSPRMTPMLQLRRGN